MLQQTRVAAVIEHYHEFLRRFPTLEKLASAREASVLAAWSGLGYYRRARMLHAAAKVVVRSHGGKFPASEAKLRELPGIGRYTAAAIASISFDEPLAVVDGNVERVLQRLVRKPVDGRGIVESRKRIAGRSASRRFQSGDDGVRRDRLYFAGTGMPDVPRSHTVPDARRAGDNNSAGPTEETGDTLCARAPRSQGIFGAARAGCIANGGDVGVTRNAKQKRCKQSVIYATAFDHGNELHSKSVALQHRFTAEWQMDSCRSPEATAAHRFSQKDSSESSNALSR